MNAFNNIIGYDSIKQELIQIADTLKNREVYEALGASSPRGLMLYGAPGVGKTTMADALVKESGRKSFICRKTKGGDSFIDEIVETFKRAEKDAPSLVLLDDLDKFANEDDNHRDAEEYVTVQACIDDLRGKEVFVLATVNDTDKLPRSLLRPGRFDRRIEVPMPTRVDSEAIIQHYLEKKKLGTELDISLVAAMLRGRSCATLETVVNEAGLLAGYQRSATITQDHIVDACLSCVFRVPSDSIRGSRTIDCSTTSQESQVVWHEAGHAVVRDVLDEGSVALVSARCQKGHTSGFVVPGFDEDSSSFDKLRKNVLVDLAGRAALDIQFGLFDMGASNDLSHAYELMFDLVTEEAYSGFSSFECHYHRYSDRQAENRETIVATLIKEYYRKTRTILMANREYLEKLAGELAKKGVLVSSDIARIRNECTIVPFTV